MSPLVKYPLSLPSHRSFGKIIHNAVKGCYRARQQMTAVLSNALPKGRAFMPVSLLRVDFREVAYGFDLMS